MQSLLSEIIKGSQVPFQAFIFDLNGTMVNDMPYHFKAWHSILNKLGSDISYEETIKECYGKNEEVIERVMPNVFPLEQRTKIGIDKEKKYRIEFAPHLSLIQGLATFIDHYSKKGIVMGIGSAAILPNINFVLQGCSIEKYFSAIVSADHVSKSKPDPETFLKCANLLKVNPEHCLVFEDTPKGVECAVNAGMKCIVIKSTHQENHFQKYKNNIIAFVEDYS